MRPFLPKTQERLDQIEALSGRPVRLLADDSLSVLATMVTARNDASYHILRYKPSNEPLDYIVSYQAGFLLRFFETPKEERFDFVPGERGLKTIREMLLATPGLMVADREATLAFAQHIHHWALMTVRSLPVGMRIDEELYQARPELHEAQVESLAFQQQQNAIALSQRVGKFTTPPTLLGPNSAYALFVDDLLGDSNYAAPYRAAGLEGEGRALLNLWRKVPADPRHDRELIDCWAEKLGMVGWYRWTPYQF